MTSTNPNQMTIVTNVIFPSSQVEEFIANAYKVPETKSQAEECARSFGAGQQMGECRRAVIHILSSPILKVKVSQDALDIIMAGTKVAIEAQYEEARALLDAMNPPASPPAEGETTIDDAGAEAAPAAPPTEVI